MGQLSGGDNREKVLGVLGGMGPSAGLKLMQSLLNVTKAERDQDHVETILYNDPTIPDRTEAILEGGESPLPRLRRNAEKLESIGADLLAMPCNTAHYYYEELASSIGIEFLHIIEEVGRELRMHDVTSVGLLATTAVLELGIYQKELNRIGIDVIYPSNHDNLMKAIYAVKADEVDKAKQRVQAIIGSFENSNLDAIVVGCTDLSVLAIEATVPVYDSTKILAKACLSRFPKYKS